MLVSQTDRDAAAGGTTSPWLVELLQQQQQHKRTSAITDEEEAEANHKGGSTGRAERLLSSTSCLRDGSSHSQGVRSRAQRIRLLQLQQHLIQHYFFIIRRPAREEGLSARIFSLTPRVLQPWSHSQASCQPCGVPYLVLSHPLHYSALSGLTQHTMPAIFERGWWSTRCFCPPLSASVRLRSASVLAAVMQPSYVVVSQNAFDEDIRLSL